MNDELKWADVAGALRELAGNAPVGLRPLMLQAAAENERQRAALEWIIMEGRIYAANHALEPLAQKMYDVAEEALKEKGK